MATGRLSTLQCMAPYPWTQGKNNITTTIIKRTLSQEGSGLRDPGGRGKVVGGGYDCDILYTFMKFPENKKYLGKNTPV